MPVALRWFLYLVALAVFVGMIVARGGPTVTDARALTLPATAISHGDFSAAATDDAIPQLLGGYPLVTAGLVVAFRPFVGASTWCTDNPEVLLGDFALEQHGLPLVWPPCAPKHGLPPGSPAPNPWYRSQAVFSLLAWAAMAAGGARLLRASGMGRDVTEVVFVVALGALPMVSDAVVRAFHPQDLVCVGLIAAALGETLRRRWIASGVLFGIAFLFKQYALLAMIAAVAAVPGRRARLRMVLPAGAVVLGGIVPFFIVNSRATIRSLTALTATLQLRGGTLVALTHLSTYTKDELARDLPVVLALAFGAWAYRHTNGMLLEPTQLLGLVVACLATRLVFEIAVYGYYFVPVAVILLALDAAARRPPYWSIGWILAAEFVVKPLEAGWTICTAACGPPPAHAYFGAVLIELLAITPIVLGLAHLAERPSASGRSVKRAAPLRRVASRA